MRYLLCLLLLAGCTTTSFNKFRSIKPKAGPAPQLQISTPEKKVLSNGLTIYALEVPSSALVTTKIIVRTGSAADPQDLPGLAGFTAALLKNGTSTRNAHAIADEIETLGSNLSIETDEDLTDLSASMLVENFAPIFEVLTDVLCNPAFASAEIERLRKERLAALDELKNDPSETASLIFRRELYGQHPYGHHVLGSKQALTAITTQHIKNFYANYFHPANTAIVVAGGISNAEIFSAVEHHLAQWHKQGSFSLPPQAPSHPEPRIAIVDRQGAPQSQVRVGHMGISRTDPEYYTLLMGNAVLGGLFNSRINMNLREDKGYTYGARSSFDVMRGVGPFVVATGVRTDVTDAAIKEIIKEIHTFRQQGVLEDELQHAKNRYILSLPGMLQTTRSLASMLANVYVYDLPLNYYQTLPAKIEAVTADDVHKMSLKYLHDDALTIVVVGDKRLVEAGLADLDRGPPQVREIE